MFDKYLSPAALAVMSIMFAAPSESAQSGEGPAPPASAKISLLDVGPEIFSNAIRYPKYYGDANFSGAAIDGPLDQRQYILGSFNGARDRWAENGFVLGTSVTQAVQGAVSGPGDDAEYFGSADLWFGLDTARAGLWSGGLIIAHAEGNWGSAVSGTGGVLPLNGDTIMPGEASSFALSELYLFQALPDNWALVAGKADFAAYADTSPFANNERTQFMHEGLINNPVLGSFVPYTAFGTMLVKEIGHEWSVAGLVATNNTKATSSGFDDISSDELTGGVAVSWNPKFGDKPGSYSALAGYTNKDTTNYDVDSGYLIEEIIGTVPIAEKSDNYALTLTGSHYLSVDPDARRYDGGTVGIGVFARFGMAPEDRNLIDAFYSVGIGGVGGPFGRINDNWGVGWAGTHFSSDFRRDAAVLGSDIDSFEHAVEAFYNFTITPAVRWTVNAQMVESAASSFDNSYVLGTRLVLDF